jgi:hypothetical protein
MVSFFPSPIISIVAHHGTVGIGMGFPPR